MRYLTVSPRKSDDKALRPEVGLRRIRRGCRCRSRALFALQPRDWKERHAATAAMRCPSYVECFGRKERPGVVIGIVIASTGDLPPSVQLSWHTTVRYSNGIFRLEKFKYSFSLSPSLSHYLYYY